MQGTFERDVRGRAAHELDEVPVLAGRISVALDVADDFGVCLAGSVETETCFNLLVFQVAVDGLGAADDLHTVVVGCIVFGKDAGVCVGVVSTNDDYGLDIQFADNLQAALKLFLGLELRTAGANHVETAGVAILVDDVAGQLHIFVVHQAARAKDEAVELVGGILLLQFIVEAADDVVAAGGLSA